MAPSSSASKDERVDARVAFQYHPTDDLMVTLDNNFSRQTINQDNYAFGVWFSQGDLRNVTVDKNGTAVDFTQAGSPTDFTAAENKQILQTNQTGLNVKYDVTEQSDAGSRWLVCEKLAEPRQRDRQQER